MKTLIISLMILSSVTAHAIEDDKAKHFAVSAFGTVILSKITNKPISAAGLMLTIGIMKELHDPIFDRGDLAADLAGVSIGYLISF